MFEKIKKWWNDIFALEVKMDDVEPQIIGKEDPKTECDCHCDNCVVGKPIVTVRDAFDHYILMKQGELSMTTLNSYEVVRDRHLQYIMDEKLDELTQERVQAAIDNEVNKGYTVKTVKSYKSLLNKIFAEYRPDFKPDIKIEVK